MVQALRRCYCAAAHGHDDADVDKARRPDAESGRGSVATSAAGGGGGGGSGGGVAPLGLSLGTRCAAPISRLRVEKIEGGLLVAGVVVAANCQVALPAFGALFALAGCVLTAAAYRGPAAGELPADYEARVSLTGSSRALGPACLAVGVAMLAAGAALCLLARRARQRQRRVAFHCPLHGDFYPLSPVAGQLLPTLPPSPYILLNPLLVETRFKAVGTRTVLSNVNVERTEFDVLPNARQGYDLCIRPVGEPERGRQAALRHAVLSGPRGAAAVGGGGAGAHPAVPPLDAQLDAQLRLQRARLALPGAHALPRHVGVCQQRDAAVGGGQPVAGPDVRLHQVTGSGPRGGQLPALQDAVTAAAPSGCRQCSDRCHHHRAAGPDCRRTCRRRCRIAVTDDPAERTTQVRVHRPARGRRLGSRLRRPRVGGRVPVPREV